VLTTGDGWIGKVVVTLAIGAASLTTQAASAQTAIVVNTASDVLTPPLTQKDACGSGAVSRLGRVVSLRDAIIVANDATEPERIVFARGLAGAHIVVRLDANGDGMADPLPALCRDGITIDGDVNGDGAPDVTLDGSTFASGSSVAGIRLAANGDTVERLAFASFPTGIEVRAGGASAPGSLSGATIEGDRFASGGDGVALTATDADSTLDGTLVVGNTVSSCSGSGVLVRAYGTRDIVEGTTIERNAVSSCGYGVNVASEGVGTTPIATLGTFDQINDLAIDGNTIRKSANPSIFVLGGNLNASDDEISGLSVDGNDIALGRNAAIRIAAGQDNSSNNTVVGEVRSNRLALNVFAGVLALGGEGAFTNLSGRSANNTVTLAIDDNNVASSLGWGVAIGGGAANPEGSPRAFADHNRVTVHIHGNVVMDTLYDGIDLGAGATGFASNNHVTIDVGGNTVCRTGWIRAEGGWFGSGVNPPNAGSGNVLEGSIHDNVATLITVLNGMPRNNARVTVTGTSPCPLTVRSLIPVPRPSG